MDKNKLLFDSHPLVILPELATAIGLNESIILQQIHYWVQINTKAEKNKIHGYVWTFQTLDGWARQFPFWSISTIQRIITKLENKKLVVSGCLGKDKFDRTKWYRIHYGKLEEALQDTNKIRSGQFDKMEDSNLTKCIMEEETNAFGETAKRQPGMTRYEWDLPYKQSLDSV